MRHFLPRLHFKKMYIVRGNHGAEVDYTKYDRRVVMIPDHFIHTIGRRWKCLFSHYPSAKINPLDHKYDRAIDRLREIFEHEECQLHFHGHTHEVSGTAPLINVSIDALPQFKPIRIGVLLPY